MLQLFTISANNIVSEKVGAHRQSSNTTGKNHAGGVVAAGRRRVKLMNSEFKNEELCIKTRSCVFKTRDFGSQTSDLTFKMMNFAGRLRCR